MLADLAELDMLFVSLCIVFLLFVFSVFISLKIIRKGGGAIKVFCVGLVLVFIVPICLLLVDFLTYRYGDTNVLIAKVFISEVQSKHYKFKLAVPGQPLVEYDINGDMWQLDARLITLNKVLGRIGFDTLYQFDRISGRYHQIEDELTIPRTVYKLGHTRGVVDLWYILNANPWLPGISARYGSSTYVPLADGAKYSVYLRQNGIQALAENDLTQDVLNDWFKAD